MRLRHLDFLRGLAVILVLFRHHIFINNTHNAGWIGVDLFFVLSGFLVSGILFREYVQYKKGQGASSPQIKTLEEMINTLSAKTVWDKEKILLYVQKQKQFQDIHCFGRRLRQRHARLSSHRRC